MARTANFHFKWEGVAVGSGSGGGTGAGSCCGVSGLGLVASSFEVVGVGALLGTWKEATGS